MALLGVVALVALPASEAPVVRERVLTNVQDLPRWRLQAGPVWVVYDAAWCAPCVEMRPHLTALTQIAPVQVVHVDYDRFRAQALAEGVTQLPAIVLLQDGREVHRLTGGQELPELLAVARAVHGAACTASVRISPVDASSTGPHSRPHLPLPAPGAPP